jgi:ferredoxin-NADP reductase
VHTLTHERPERWIGETGLIDRPMLERHGPDRGANPQSFVCGPTPFVEAIANHLVALGYPGDRIKTERFGPSGDVK